MNRADRMLAALTDGKPRTRHEIFESAGCFFLTNNAASELRARGQGIAHWKHDGEDVYQLVGSSLSGVEALPSEPADPGSGATSPTESDAPAALPREGAAPLTPLSAAPSRLSADEVEELLKRGGFSEVELRDVLQAELDEAYEARGYLLDAVAISPEADARRVERVAVVDRQIRELQAALQFSERTAA